jgi:general secretion pathway protein G
MLTETIYNMRARKKINAFTLIEILVVVVILAILAALVVPKIMSRPEEARVVRAKQDIASIESAMNLYKLDNGFYPSTEQGIQALVTKPSSDPVPQDWQGYLPHFPQDPWGHAYQYTDNDGSITISSFGPSGHSGGAGEINNEQLNG